MLEGVRNHPVARNAIAIQERYGRDAGGNMAGAIAYFGFLSLFPLLVLALSIVGFVLAGNPTLQAEWSQQIAKSVPGVETLIGDNLKKLVDLRGWAGVVALVGLIWTGRAVVVSAETGLGRIFGKRPKENFLKENARRLATTLGLGSLALVGTAVTAAAGGFEAEGFAGVLLTLAGVVVGFGIDFLLFITTYRLLILRPGPSWRALWPGALFVAIGWTGLKFFGAWYATRTLENSESVYGPFAATVAVLVLLYLAGRLFVYGAELIAVLRDGKEGAEGGGAVQREDGETTPQTGAMRDTGQTGGTKPEKLPGDRSTVDLVTTVAGDVGALVRKEVELAKQEVTEGIAARVKAVAALAVVGVLGLYALAFVAAAGARALDQVVPLWASRLIVAGVFLLIAGIAMLFGVRRMKKPPLKPVKTKETIKEDVAWAKAQLKR